MNEEYLKGLHNYLNIDDDYDTWVSSISGNEEYLKGLHGYLKIDDDYDTWNSSVFGDGLKSDAIEVDIETEPEKELVAEIASEPEEEQGVLDNIYNTAKDFIGVAVDGFEAGWTTEDYLEVFGGDFSDEAIDKLIEADKKLSSKPPTQAMIDFAKDAERLGGGFEGNILAAVATPSNYDAMAQVVLQSLAQMAGTALGALRGEETFGTIAASAGVGAGTGASLGLAGGPFAELTVPAGAVLGTMYGGLGGLSLAMENGLTFVDLLKKQMDEDGENWDRQSIQSWLSNEDNYKNIRNSALARGLTIATIDAISAPLAGGAGKVVSKIPLIAKSSAKTSKLAKGLTASTTDVGSGMVSEVGGQLAAGQDLDAQEIVLEGFAGLPTGIVRNIGETIVSKKPIYKLNGEEIDRQTMFDIVETVDDQVLAKLDIDIENDSELQNVTRKKVIRSRVKSQLDTRVTNEEDRNNLTDLELERKSIETNKTQSAKNQIKEIDQKIKEITDKYEGKKSDPTLEQEKQEVREEVVGRKVDKTIEFLETQAGEKLGKKIYVVKSEKDSEGNIIKSADEKAQEIYDKYVKENPGVKKQNVKGSEGFKIGDISVINEDVAMEVGSISVGSHETLHFVIDNYLDSYFSKDNNKFKNKSDKEILDARKNMISNFKSKLSRKELNILEKRAEIYKKEVSDFDPETSTEWFTWFSDAVESGEIKFNENLFTKVKDFVNNLLTDVGIRKEFSTADQAYRFMKDYSKSISKGKLSKRALKIAKTEQKADKSDVIGFSKKSGVAETAEEKTIRRQLREEDIKEIYDLYAWDKNQEQWEEFLETDEGRKILDKIIKPYEVEIEAIAKGDVDIIGETSRPLISHIKAFNPLENNDLAGYIGGYLSRKVGTARKTVEKGAAPKDIKTKRIGEKQEGGREFDIEDKSTAPDVDVKAELNFRNKLKIETGGDLYNSILKKAKIILSTLSTSLTVPKTGETLKEVKAQLQENPNNNKAIGNLNKIFKDFRKTLKNSFDTQLFKEIKDSMGTRDAYNEYLRSNKKAILTGLPIADLVAMQKAKGANKILAKPIKENLSPNEIKQYEGSADLMYTSPTSGPTVYERLNPGDKEFVDFFNVRGRKDALARNISGKLGEDATMETLDSEDVMDAFLIKNPTLKQIPTEMLKNSIAQSIDSGVGVKFSKNAQKQVFKEYSGNFVENLKEQNLGVNRKSIQAALYKTFINENPTKVWGETIEDQQKTLSKFANDLVNPIKKYLKSEGKRSLKALKAVPDFGEFTLEEIAQKELATNLIKILDLKKDGVKSLAEESELSENVTLMRELEADFINYLVDKYGKVKAVKIALTMLKGHNATSAKIGATNLGTLSEFNEKGKRRQPRYQYFESLEDFVNSTLNTIPGVKIEIGKTKGKSPKSVVKSIVIDKKSIEPFSVRESQTSKSKEHFEETYDKREKESQEAWDTLTEYLDFMYKNGNNLTFALTMMSLKSNMDTILKSSALAKYYYVGPKMSPSKLRYEHMIPTEYIALKLTQHFVGKKIDLQALKYKYNVAIIPKIMDDNINVQLQKSMPSFWNETFSETERYFNDLMLGYQNMYALEVLGGENKGEIIGKDFLKLNDEVIKAKYFNIQNLSNSVVNFSKSTTNEDVISYAKTVDEALAIARDPNAPVKKIRVFDFDDTLARSKSLVFYNRPNESGKPVPSNKAIFMIGGPGSGKTNIGKGLQLGRDGFKVVNQDIYIESEKTKRGLPEIEKDYTAEQRSLRSKIGAEGRKAAQAKMDKYAKAGNGMVIDGTGASYNATMKKVNALKEQGYEVFMVYGKTSKEVALGRNRNRKERSLKDFIVEKTHDAVVGNIDQYKKELGDNFVEIDTETIEYGKPLPSDFVSNVKSKLYATERGRLNAEEFASQGSQLVDEGFAMDFSDFNIVREGERGPLFDIAKKIEKARGTEDVFVLTARAPESQQAIHEFLKSEGLNIPIENITGLGNSTGAAKASWIVDKAADGYNDFYFADDAVQNVKAVQDALSQLDVKSKVQQAKVKFSKNVNQDFNKIIEQTTGIASEKEYSKAKAKVRGAGKGNKKFFIPYSAEDFMGLIYPLLSKGKLGDSQMAWFKQNLLDPYARAIENLSTDRLQLMEDFKALKKALEVPKNLRKKNDSGFTNEQAVRVYLFNKMGYDVPGLSKTDLQELVDIVNSDGLLKAFADQLMNVTKGDGYAKPGQSWLAGTITTDLIDVLNTVKRKKYLEQSGFLENADLIFSETNLNKLEAAYGEKYREAMENILKRMKSGKNRLFSGNRLSNRVLDYINGSIGAIMFFNARSAVLQTISAVNFVNWSFNNPIKAGKAFANQKQYWSDFMELMNSDYLMDRRNGLKLNISESEIADAAATSKNKAKAAISYILQKGFLPTQFADSFAIASGGATFYRNRINDLIKNEGLTEAEAKKKAMLEFRQVAEQSQQSSDPSKISAQQSSDLGRVILAFANTPMQYARLQKRAVQDLINRRGDAKSHVSKIIYYGVVQNIIFNALQQGLFALGFGDDEEDEAKNKRYYKVANGMLDSQLRGLGIAGATVGVVKNFLLDVYERSDRKRPEYVDAVYKLLQISPPISSKISKVRQAAYQFDSKKRREEIFEKGFSLDNPAYEASAKVISATTNIPLDRLYSKVNNIEAALAEDTEVWQSIAMLAGWPEWQIKPDNKKQSSKSSKKKEVKHIEPIIFKAPK